eukprot:Skav208632  [mRNA]  locus=scaffold3433:134880:136300:- [translate_table: standard]
MASLPLRVCLVPPFSSPGRTSKMFRVTWRDMSRTLTNEEVNGKHEKVLERALVAMVAGVVEELKVELR